MSKSLITIGSLIILYTVIAKVTGIPTIADFMPVGLFSSQPKDGTYYKVVPSGNTTHSNLYTYLTGFIFILLGFLLLHLKKRSK